MRASNLECSDPSFITLCWQKHLLEGEARLLRRDRLSRKNKNLEI